MALPGDVPDRAAMRMFRQGQYNLVLAGALVLILTWSTVIVALVLAR
jgi:hypothetical protein